MGLGGKRIIKEARQAGGWWAAATTMAALALAASCSRAPAPPGVRLELKPHRQEHSYSCEPAALKMVLNYHGVAISEGEIIAKMPFDRTPRKGNVWGDPDLGFVGDIDARSPAEGYGIHWKPMAKLASLWKRTEILENGRLTDLSRHIAEKRPVVIWIHEGPGKALAWVSPQGRPISAIEGEHTVVVHGFIGAPESPREFLILDPEAGPRMLPSASLDRIWSAFNRSGIVVHP